MAERFYCPDPPSGGRLALTGDEARHLARVRRVEVGQVVEVFDGRGWASRAEVVEIARDHVALVPEGEPLPDRSAPCRLTLATAVPKGERFDWLVEKATELGVDRLVPLVTERSVVDPRAAKLDRLRRLVVEACKQCGRSRLPTIEPPVAWDVVLAQPTDAPRLVAHPGGLPPARWPRPRRGAEVWLAVGPEGGFAAREIEAARASGWSPVGLTATVLRIETAGLAAASVLLALLGDESA